MLREKSQPDKLRVIMVIQSSQKNVFIFPSYKTVLNFITNYINET